MSHFRFIEKNIDVSRILADIKDEDWDKGEYIDSVGSLIPS